MDTLTKNSSDLSQMLDPEYFKSQSSGDSNNQNNNQNNNNNNNDINNNNNNNNIKDSPKKKTVRFTSQVEFVEPSQSQNNNNNNQNNNNNNNNNSSPDINMFDINNNNNNNIFDVFQDDIPNSFMLSVIDGSQQIIFNEEDDSEEIQQSLSQQQQQQLSSSLDNYLLDSSLQQKQLSIELGDDEYYQSISLPIWDAVTSQDPKMVMKFGKIKRKRGIVIDNRRKTVPDITIDDLMKKDLLRIGDTLCYCIGGVNHFALLLRDGYIEYDSLRLPSVHAFVIHVLSNLEKNKKFRWFSPWDSVSVRGKSLNFIRSIFQSKFYKGGDNIIYQYEPTTTTTPIVKKQESPIKSSSPQKNILKESPSPSKNLKRTLDNTDNSQNLNNNINNNNNNNNNNNEKDITVKNSKDDDDDKIIKKQKTDDNIENNGKQQMAIDDESTQSIQPVLIDDESTQKIIEQKDENEKAGKVEKVEKEDEEATQAMVDNLNNEYDNSPTIPMTTMECVRANLNTGFRDDDEDENENENENKNENKKVTSKNNSESTLQNSNSDLPIIYSSPNYQQNKFQTPKTPAPSPSSTQDHFNRPTIEQPSSPYKSPSKSQQQQQQASQKLSQQQQQASQKLSQQHQSPSKSQEQQASQKLSQQQQQQQQSPSKSQEQQASQKSSQQHQSPSKSQEQQASQKSSQQQSPSKSQVSQQSLSHQLTQLQQSPAKSQEQQQSPAKSQQQQQQSTSSLLNNTISPKQSQNNTNADSPYSSISLHQPIFVTPSPRGSNMGSIVSNGGGSGGGSSSGSSSISGSISGSISSSSDGGLNHQQSQSSQSSQNSSSSSSSSSIFSIPAGQKPPTPSPLPSIQPSLPIQNATTTTATNQSSQLGSSSNNINSNSNNHSNTYDELRSFQIPQSQNNFDDSQQTLDVDQQPSQYLSPKKVSQHSQQKNNQLSQQKSLSQQLPSQQQLSSSQQQQQQQQPIIIEKENISSPLNKSKIELPIIIATGLTGLMQLHIHSLCSAIGGKLVTEFNDQVTHVVCSTLDGDGGKDNLAKRTIKYQMGIGRGGLWLVSFDWILESLNENQWVNESEFEIQGDSIGLGSPLKSRQQLFETKRLFYGQSFYLAGEFQSPSRQEIISVIKSSGGIVLDQLPPKPQNLNEMLQSTCTVICHPLLSSIDQSLIQTIYLSTKHIPISFSWIFDSISKYKLLPKDNYYQYPNSNNGKFKINDPSVAY
ncbi:hypothetical protein ACTFIW_010626 [Dictyostelium discoideum]